MILLFSSEDFEGGRGGREGGREGGQGLPLEEVDDFVNDLAVLFRGLGLVGFADDGVDALLAEGLSMGIRKDEVPINDYQTYLFPFFPPSLPRRACGAEEQQRL